MEKKVIIRWLSPLLAGLVLVTPTANAMPVTRVPAIAPAMTTFVASVTSTTTLLPMGSTLHHLRVKIKGARSVRACNSIDWQPGIEYSKSCGSGAKTAVLRAGGKGSWQEPTNWRDVDALKVGAGMVLYRQLLSTQTQFAAVYGCVFVAPRKSARYFKVGPFEAGYTGTPWTAANFQVRPRPADLSAAFVRGSLLFYPCS